MIYEPLDLRPSDRDRSENEILDEVCSKLEEAQNEILSLYSLPWSTFADTTAEGIAVVGRTVTFIKGEQYWCRVLNDWELIGVSVNVVVIATRPEFVISLELAKELQKFKGMTVDELLLTKVKL